MTPRRQEIHKRKGDHRHRRGNRRVEAFPGIKMLPVGLVFKHFLAGLRDSSLGQGIQSVAYSTLLLESLYLPPFLL